MTEGQMLIDGDPGACTKPDDARAHGIETVYLALAP